MTIDVVPFAVAVEDVSAGNAKIPQSEFLGAGSLAVVDQGQSLIAGYTDDTTAAVKATKPVIVFGDHTRAFKFVDFPFAMGADGVKVLRSREGFDPKFVYHYLRSRTIPNAGYSRHFKFLKEVSVPRPPLPEQRRVGAILDHADALRAERRQTLALLDALTQSIFHDMFGDPMANDRSLPHAAIGDIAEVVTGNSPSRLEAANFGDDIEWIKSDNLGGPTASTAEEWLSERGRRRARTAPAGSILVTCIAGSRTSIGKASMVDREVAFNQQINAILPSRHVDAMFLLAQLKTAPELVRSKSTNGMKGLVNKSSFQSIEVLTPPLAAQREFSSRVTAVSRQRGGVQRACASADELFASLQFRAFDGKL